MKRSWKVLAIFGGISVLAAMAVVALFVGFGYGALLCLLVLGAAYSWMLFAFLHYRQCRQEEFLQVMIAAAEAEAPLAPALAAYLDDRPQSGLRELWVALLLNFVVPGYYWIWYRLSNYDQKVDRVAELLEDGHSLH